MAGVSFYLNGEPVTLEDPPPDLLLIDWLRSPEVALTGVKKGCGQGGCGACTVILSAWDERTGRVEHRAINSCLRPVCALGGLAVTTVEGTGAPAPLPSAHLVHRPTFSRSGPPPGYVLPTVRHAAGRAAAGRQARLAAAAEAPTDGGSGETMSEVAYRLAMNNGTQCGYCTTGFVMTMSALLAAEPRPTKRQIEDVFDGNICRCTGYRPILTGMKTFARDWSERDESERMQCLGSPLADSQLTPRATTIPLPADGPPRAEAVEASAAGRAWTTPTTVEQACRIMREAGERRVRLVHGNTSFGVYPQEVLDAELLADVRLIPELHGIEADAEGVRAGAGTTYAELIDALAPPAAERATSRLGAAELMARRTAGAIVRNAASIGGNAMLVLHHIAAGTGEPFPSDLMTALSAIDATVELAFASSGERVRRTVAELVEQVGADPALARDLLLIRIHLPAGDARDVVLAQKTAFRAVNAHAVVNAATRLRVDEELIVAEAAVALGGIAPYPCRFPPVEQALVGSRLALDALPTLIALLRSGVEEELARWRERMSGLPSEGVTDAYRADLATGFLYKAVVNALLERAPDEVPPELRSSGEITWGRWPLSGGRQHYETQAWKAPVAQPLIKDMALYQATGRVHYTHELPVPPTTVDAAFVQSRRALATFHLTVPGRPGPATREQVADYLRARFDAFVELITYEQIPAHGINLQGMGADQPLLAVDQVRYVGQAIALVTAESEQAAIAIAEHASEQCVAYEPVDWPPPWNAPVLSLEQAIAQGSVFPDCPTGASFVSHVWKVTRPGSRFDWTTAGKDPLDRAIAVRGADVGGLPCTVVESTQQCGGQAHFYMETQACVALPLDGDRMLLLPSSQSPMAMHETAAMALGVQRHRIEVEIAQLGGGYGGKTEPARFVAGPTAVAARVLDRPVRLALKREHDSAMIGKRHGYYAQYQIAIDAGERHPEDRGLIRGMQCRMWGDGGAFYDCSYVVSNCIQLRADNAYRVANFENQIDVCRTNTAPSTAMRAFGDIQGKLMTENAIDDAAFAIGMTAEEVRERNLYELGDATPFGQALSFCYMRDVWAYLKRVSDYERRLAEVEEFNVLNRWRKRGIAMVPVKYGSGYNFVQIEQAAAHVVVNSDGSVVVSQGGVEMGQGLTTVVLQVASYVLNVPMEMIHVDGADTNVIPNPTSSGASTGTPYNAAAVKQTCEVLRQRLTEFGYQLLKDNGQEWCASRGVDFWSYGQQGWAHALPGPDGSSTLVWQNLISHAYAERVGLAATFSAPMTGGETPVASMTYKPIGEQPQIPGIEVDEQATPGGAVDSFLDFTYSAACSVVEVDVLTGETKVLSSDIVYDIGWSLNPAIDVGQVEGAFVQGLGYVLTEQLVLQPDGEDAGRLTTDNTWRYKPPATATIPLELNTYLYPRDQSSGVPDNPNDLFSSKEVGEPPLVLASSVFFAVKAAVRASRLERGLDGLFRLDAPATVQEVRRACEVTL